MHPFDWEIRRDCLLRDLDEECEGKLPTERKKRKREREREREGEGERERE